MDSFVTHPGVGSVAPQQCRHRPDHPGRLPQAGQPGRLRGRALRGLARGHQLRAQQPPVCRWVGARRRSGLWDGLLPRACRLGPDELWVPRGVVLAFRRHLPRKQRQAGIAHRGRAAGRRELIWKYLENEPGAQLTVDLASRTVTAGDIVVAFEVDDYTRWRLMEGLDDIGLTLRHADLVAEFEAGRSSYKPVTQ